MESSSYIDQSLTNTYKLQIIKKVLRNGAKTIKYL